MPWWSRRPQSDVDKDYDLLVIGDLNADLILTGEDPVPVFGQVEKLVDDGLLTVGGSCGIAACAAVRLGLRTACVGVLGDDALGSFMREALRSRGVDVSGCPTDRERRTGITVVLARRGKSDRAILTAPGTAAALRAGQVDRDMLRRSRHVHCGAYFVQPALQPDLPGLFAESRRHGASCSLDTNWDPAERWDGGLAEALGACDVFFPNEAEARAITGCVDAHAAAAKLGAGGATVAVKRGAAGALVRAGGKTLCAAAPAAAGLVDTTGAGDAFDAGYLFGLLNGWAAERCLALAVACGTLSTRGTGGVDGQARLEEAQQLASRIEVQAA